MKYVKPKLFVLPTAIRVIEASLAKSGHSTDSQCHGGSDTRPTACAYQADE